MTSKTGARRGVGAGFLSIMDSSVSVDDKHVQNTESLCNEEEIEFVSEGPLRPVLECIDLNSSDEDSKSSFVIRKVKDHVDRQKDRVASTLDRLALHVEVEKKNKAEKNKAFQEKLHGQHAHGLQELECIKGLPGTDAARICVNQWLKMPGPKPGVVCSSRRNMNRSHDQSPVINTPIMCPIVHCYRKYDNGQLLLGHLKRFDHSPCDPTIHLHGAPANSYACIVCLQRFNTRDKYDDHVTAKARLADGHENNIRPQVINSFACPLCFLLFNLRDECLQHMSDSNHFLQAIQKDDKGIPCPVPFPLYVKNVLIALCKDIPFQVKCSSCNQELRSHTELSAHFRTRCRNAHPVAYSEQSIAEVVAVFLMEAYCLSCRKMLKSDMHIAKHAQRTGHKAKLITSLEESIMAFCYINEGIKTPSDLCLSACNARLKPNMLKRTINNNVQMRTDFFINVGKNTIKDSPTKRQKQTRDLGISGTVWFCECLQKCSTEKDAEKHIMMSNGICHKCLVCNKLANDLSVIRLHMSRFHGGAHLNSFIFWCKGCRAELPRTENMMAHVCECHKGHSYYFEQETWDNEPSTSTQICSPSQQVVSETSSTAPETTAGHWQCHICEEMFDSEDSVRQHCNNISIHQFHKFSCDICKNRFHKVETLFRHSQHQHDGEINMKYVCGLCDLYFEDEKDFHGHYNGLHSSEYGFVPEQMQSLVKNEEQSFSNPKPNEDCLTCGCLENYSSKAQREEANRLCLARLLQKGSLWYSCSNCSATGQTYDSLKIHDCTKSPQPLAIDCVVKCSCCSTSFKDPTSALQHYHTTHCFLQKPNIKQFKSLDSQKEVFEFMASGACAKAKHGKSVTLPAPKLHGETPNRCPIEMELSKPVSCDAENKKTGEDTQSGKIDIEEESDELPDLDFLCTMTHIVFVDLDNWAQFFSHLPGYLNQGIFVWGFQGGKSNWKRPVNCKVFNYLSNTGSFFLHPHCSDSKDAADFAICMHAGRLDEQLPKQIPFTILSGDKGFLELESQFKKTQRSTHILNPHHLEGDMMCALLNSISDTTQDANDDTEDELAELDEDANLNEAIKRSMTEM
ncbi:zinc finger protein 451 L homeolog isoform X1 [Xenopus laevis]|uniref:Zinc finger protein 451 L homeolog isoform X1 n=4 Tax=Xenopus laevis TaxID=8355 RepID=A0A8J0VD87_XENLA|nr:zinc finger protein 451 L homeolog isoform X1 [Xenopus laevis]